MSERVDTIRAMRDAADALCALYEPCHCEQRGESDHEAEAAAVYDAFIASGALVPADVLGQVEAERDALRAEVESLKAALGQQEHVIAFDEHGWSIEHLVECRPFMSKCGYHRAVAAAAEVWTGPPRPEGRYALTLDELGVALISTIPLAHAADSGTPPAKEDA